MCESQRGKEMFGHVTPRLDGYGLSHRPFLQHPLSDILYVQHLLTPTSLTTTLEEILRGIPERSYLSSSIVS